MERKRTLAVFDWVPDSFDAAVKRTRNQIFRLESYKSRNAARHTSRQGSDTVALAMKRMTTVVLRTTLPWMVLLAVSGVPALPQTGQPAHKHAPVHHQSGTK